MIKVNGLSYGYPNKNKEVLKNISFLVEAGEMVVLLGGSGAGKSTLLKCIGRLIDFQNGEVYIEGRNFSNLNLNKQGMLETQKKIAYIFQDFNLIERNTVLNNVLDGRLGYTSILRSSFYWHKKEDIELAERSLERVGMLSYIDERVENLSGGQKQRVSIARALAQEPKIILADEPVASLDPKLMKEVMDLLQKICFEDGITFLISLHFLDIAKKYAKKMIGINKGEIVFNDKVLELTEKNIVDIYGETKDWMLFGKIGY